MDTERSPRGGRGADRGPAQPDGARGPARGVPAADPGRRLRHPGGVRRGLRPAGRRWKVGCTALATQRLFGIEGPFYGPVLAPVVFASPADLPAADFPLRGIECEFAFRLGGHLSPRAAHEPHEAAERVSAPIPAIEAVSPRLDHPIKYGAPSAIADCGVNGALVLGAARLDWQSLDLATHEVRLEIDGAPKAAGTARWCSDIRSTCWHGSSTATPRAAGRCRPARSSAPGHDRPRDPRAARPRSATSASWAWSPSGSAHEAEPGAARRA